MNILYIFAPLFIYFMIDKLLFSIFFFVTVLFSYGQNAQVSTDTSSVNNQVGFSYTIIVDTVNIAELRTELYRVDELDTTLYFSGSYDFTLEDPSSFYAFELTDTGVRVHVGYYDPGTYFARIYILREGEAVEEITIQ